MSETESIHLLTRLRGIRPIRITNKRKALGATRLPVLGQENTSNVSVLGEHVAQILFLGELRHVGNTQSSAIVAVEFAAHLLACARTATQMRGNVAARAGAQTASCTAGRIVWHFRGGDIAFGGHGVLEGTFCGEMVSLANTALDLCVLELRLLLRFVALIFVAGFPVGDGAEGDVFGDGDGVCLWAGGLALFLSEFRPLLSFGDAGVYDLLYDGLLDAPCCLVFLAVFADAVGDYGFGAVFVLDDLLGWEGGEGGLLVFFFRPVGAAVVVLSA